MKTTFKKNIRKAKNTFNDFQSWPKAELVVRSSKMANNDFDIFFILADVDRSNVNARRNTCGEQMKKILAFSNFFVTCDVTTSPT